ncbi:MAG: hypothetical protein ACI4XM_08150 [Candidatus Coprovivens sp.]
MNIKTIIENIQSSFKEEDYSQLTEMERFTKIRMYKVPKEVFNYLKNLFNNLHIEIVGKYEGNIIDLMNEGKLEGWCWQTTETASLFMDDSTYIERGYLKFDINKTYYHSWLNFKYKGIEYVFDPCLQILCRKDYYNKIFEIQIKGKVTAKEVKEYFINYINNHPNKENTEEHEKVLNSILGKTSLKRTKNEIIIHDEENPNAPMYRNGVGYKTTLENGKIKRLIAHYYYTDC